MNRILAIKAGKVAQVIEVDYTGPLTPEDYPVNMDDLRADNNGLFVVGDTFDIDRWTNEYVPLSTFQSRKKKAITKEKEAAVANYVRSLADTEVTLALAMIKEFQTEMTLKEAGLHLQIDAATTRADLDSIVWM